MFTTAQREELRKLGLIEAQVDALEATLPLSRAWLQKPPTLQDVRDELRKLSGAIARAEAAMSKLVSAGKNTPARYEAQARIMSAAFEMHDDPHDDSDIMKETSSALSRMKALLNRAAQSLPNTQRRHETAHFLPVARIDVALVSGFTKGHGKRYIDKEGIECWALLPPYDLKPSKFRRIVGICYAAMGLKARNGTNDLDPERAIRNYIARRKRTTQAQRAAIEAQTLA